MKTKVAIALFALVALVPHAGAEMFVTHFDGEAASDGTNLRLNDVYLNTVGAEWLSSLFYCELEEGLLYQPGEYLSVPSMRWICVPGVNPYDTWLAPNVTQFADGNELAYLFSGDPANAAASITFICDMVDGEIPPWQGIAARFAFTTDASGVWGFKVNEKGSDPIIHTGIITDGQMIWQAPLPGDLNMDGYVNTSDLDIVRANWAAETIILGDYGYGDPTADGEVGGDDLDIVRANWGQTAAVPEPGVGWLILGLGLAVLARHGNRTPIAKQEGRIS